MNMKYLLSSVLCLIIGFSVNAQTGYEIKAKIEGYTQKKLYLANHYGDKQYFKDSTEVQADGSFVFKSEEDLPGGVYMIVMKPNNDFIQLFIDKDQIFSFSTKIENTAKNIRFEGSKLNTDFYNYLNFLGEQRPIANTHGEALKAARDTKDSAAEKAAQTKLDAINTKVTDYQNNLVKQQPNTLLGKIVKASFPIKTPDFSDQEKPDLARYIYTKEHWFDNIDLGDPRFLRAPIMFEKINYYIEKLTPQNPDSIANSIDFVLAKTKPAEESYKFYLIHFLNKYAASKIVGMDGVYVHIAEKYYKAGEASWTEQEQLEKIIDNAARLKPILIGKTAPNIAIQEIDLAKTMELKDEENEHKRYGVKRNFSLHDIDADYTVFLIWAPDCGHCKKSMPDIVKFHDEYKSKGVEIVALCNSIYKDIPECAKMIEEKGMVKFVNAIDPYIKSKYKQLYDVRSTPQVFILNKEKEIIMKKIAAEQLSEVMEQIMKRDKEKLQG